MTPKKRSRSLPAPILFVCVPSPEADETTRALEALGMSVTRADNVCYAEIYADAQRFAGAIYDRSLEPAEQASLARVMRIRWPWMRILRWVPAGAALLYDELFDWTVFTQSEVTACAASRLTQ